MQINFFQFISTGKYNVVHTRFIDKIKYLGRMYVFIFFLGLLVSGIKEIISSHTGDKIFDTTPMKEMTLQYILMALISPLYTGILLIGLTHYHYKKVLISVSCIVSSFICLLIYKYFDTPILLHQYLDVSCLFLSIIALIYFCFIPIIRSCSGFLEKFWKKRFVIIIYLFAILYSIIIFLYTDGNFQSKMIEMVMRFIIILILMHIRAALELKYAILFDYLLALPGLIILMYFYLRLP